TPSGWRRPQNLIRGVNGIPLESQKVETALVRQSRDFTMSSAPIMVPLGRCACLYHSCSLTVERAHDSKDECERSLWRVLGVANVSPRPALERASSRHTDQSGALISLVVKQGYEIVARLSALEGWQMVERLEQRPVKRRQKDHPGHAALRLSIA